LVYKPKNSSKKPEINNLKKSKIKQQIMQSTDQNPPIKTPINSSSKIKKYTSETLKIIGNQTVKETDLKKNNTKKNKTPLKEVTNSIDNIKIGKT